MLVLLLVVIVVIVAAFAAFAAGYALASARRRDNPPSEMAPIAEMRAPPERPPTRVAFTELAAVGTPDWRLAMEEVGERMRRSGVRLVVFTHGSFVGDDPFSIAQICDDAMPALPIIGRALRGFTRAQISRFLGDLSNFPRGYIDAFHYATGVDATEFTWSGENHHAARVQGAVRLARTIALHGGGTVRPGDRVLLIGHSHGGQLFALLSQLVARTRGYEELVRAAAARGEDVAALEDHLFVLRRCPIDVATFGTPPRYFWAGGTRFRLLHVINHEHDDPCGESATDLARVRDSDYIRRLGAPGSDLPAFSARDRALNLRLDQVLDAGNDVYAWMRHITRGLRTAPCGHTVLVDYGKKGRAAPSLWETGFGHSAYLRRDAMLFHISLIAGQFYPTGPVTPPRLGQGSGRA